MSSASQRKRFFAIMDRGSTIRGAAIQAGVTPDIGYRWVKNRAWQRSERHPRVYTDAEKAEFFRLLAEQGNVSAVARQLGFVRVACYKWAHRAGIFSGRSVDAQRDEFLKLRAGGLSRADAAEREGADKRSAQDWERGIRQFYGGRVYPDGRVVSYPYAERISKMNRPRTTYLVSDRAELAGLERPITGGSGTPASNSPARSSTGSKCSTTACRRHSSLGYMSPIAYEKLHTNHAEVA